MSDQNSSQTSYVPDVKRSKGISPLTLLENGDLYFVHPDHGMFKYNVDSQVLTPLKESISKRHS